jgi:hypothetical protein
MVVIILQSILFYYLEKNNIDLTTIFYKIKPHVISIIIIMIIIITIIENY